MSSGLRQAASFLTPLTGAADPSPSALPWFPVVGAVLGSTLGGLWWLADGLFAPAVAAALVVAADLALTGMLHLDGLVDTSDGLLPHLDRERRLEVMRQPDAGAFGVGVASAIVLLRWSVIASLAPAPLLLAGLWCLSRTTMAAASRLLPYARAGGGLATAFGAGSGERGRGGVLLGLLGSATAIGLAASWQPWPGVVAIAAAMVASAAVLALARRRIGGFTGDVLGAAGIVGETAGLVVAAGRW